mgnify:CR=1 FL=1|jgi:hypothetical protein
MAYQVISPIMNYFLANNMAKEYTDIEGEMCQFVQINPTLNNSFQEPIYFGSQTMLDGENATITGIEFLTPTSLSNNTEGLVNDYSNSTAKYGILYISDLKRQVIAQLPLYSLVTQNNGGKIKFTFFNDQVWQNCYIEFNLNNFTTPTQPLMFNVYYVPKIKN